MKSWFISTGVDTEFKCNFISYYYRRNTLWLGFHGIKVKFEVDREQFYMAKSGKWTVVTALSTKGNKEIELIFK